SSTPSTARADGDSEAKRGASAKAAGLADSARTNGRSRASATSAIIEPTVIGGADQRTGASSAPGGSWVRIPAETIVAITIRKAFPRLRRLHMRAAKGCQEPLRRSGN